MSTPDRSTPPVFGAADEEVASYRAISSLAVAGLLAGLLSPLAMVAASLWLTPLVAVVLSSLALRRIATRSPELVGRPAALAGLLLGTAFLVAAPVDELLYRRFLGQQARQFAEIWIDAVRHSKANHLEVYKTHHLMIDPKHRLPLEGKLADFYRQNETWRRSLLDFVKLPVMQTLFALGTDAEIRYYETVGVRREEPFELVQQIYAVTYPHPEGARQQQPKTFFIALSMQRSVDAGSGRAGWTMLRVDGNVRPPGW